MVKINDVTYSKAIGILLMVLCHCSIPNDYIVNFVYMFHMPLFIFLSGYCLKPEYFTRPRQFVFKRLRGIYWPYLKWSFLFLLIHNFLFALNIYNVTYDMPGFPQHPYSMSEALYRLAGIAFAMHGHDLLVLGYWFMRALLYGSLIAFAALWLSSFVEHKMRFRYGNMLAGTFFLAVCLLLNHFDMTLTPLKICSRDFLSALLFLIGHGFRTYGFRKFRWWELMLAVTFVAVASLSREMALSDETYKNSQMLIYLPAAILGTWAVYSLPYQRLKGYLATILQFIGNNTLTILTWHFLSFKLVSLIILKNSSPAPTTCLAEFPVIEEYAKQGWWLAYFLTAVLITCAIAFCNRWIRNSWLKL